MPKSSIFEGPLSAMSLPFKSDSSSDYSHLPSTDERKYSHDGEHLPTPDSFDSVDEPLYRRPRSNRRKTLLIWTFAIICVLALLLPSPLSRFRRLDEPVAQSEQHETEPPTPEPPQPTEMHMEEYGIQQKLHIDEDAVANASKAMIIASFRKQNVDWLDRIPSDWQIKRYMMDDPNPANNLSVPANRGREAMAYLTYIIDNFDGLPDFMVFTHGHRRSWHQPEPLPMKIRALNLTALAYEDYISLQCGDQMGCETIPYLDTEPDNVNWPGQRGIRGFWEYIMPGEELPRYISHKCCAQFAVTREAVRRHTREQWEHIRSPLLGDWDEMHEKYEWAKAQPYAPFPNGMVQINDWTVGTWYEKFWHIWMGKGAHYCPSIEYCNRVHFKDAIRCDQYADFSPFDSETWVDSVCRSVFDDVAPDEEPDWKKWDILSVDATLRGQKWGRIHADKEFIHKMHEEEAKRPKPPPPPPPPGPQKPAAQAAHEQEQKQDEADRAKHDQEHPPGPGNGDQKPDPPKEEHKLAPPPGGDLRKPENMGVGDHNAGPPHLEKKPQFGHGHHPP